MSDFKDQAVLITGATSGIGRDTALAFAKEGAKVAISGRREKEGKEVEQAINDAGGKGLFIKADVGSISDVENMVNHTVEQFGGLKYCFVNAGVWGDPQLITEESVANINQVTDINVKGVLFTLKHVIPPIQKAGGAIVTNASILGMRAMPGYSVYIGSKFAVVGITRGVALEVAEQGVRVNCVAPGPIETDMLRAASGGETEQFSEMIPMKQIGQPTDIAETVMWLCSDRAKYITGQTISVDGGYCAG